MNGRKRVWWKSWTTSSINKTSTQSSNCCKQSWALVTRMRRSIIHAALAASSLTLALVLDLRAHLFARFEIFSQLELITEKPAIREALFYCLRRRFVVYSSKWIKAHEDEADDAEADHDEGNGENEEMDYNDGRKVNATHGIDALLAMASQEVCEEIVTEVVFEEIESRVVCPP